MSKQDRDLSNDKNAQNSYYFVNSVTLTNSKKALLDFFTEGVPNYEMANETIRANARQKVAEITPILTQALKELKEELPLATSTADELDKANLHLDSRSQQHWSLYNHGYISMSKQVEEAIDNKIRELEEQ